MCRSTLVPCLALIALLAALPAAAAPADPAAANAAAAALGLDSGACSELGAFVVEYDSAPALGAGDAVPAVGCYAEAPCIHGGFVSCSSPLGGTCSSSSQGCGRVTCSGQTTFCAGTCVGSHHCGVFCDFAPNAECDQGCCDCDG
jgi:hypothetical protein